VVEEIELLKARLAQGSFIDGTLVGAQHIVNQAGPQIERLQADERRLDWFEQKHAVGMLDVRSTKEGVLYGFNGITGDQTLYESFRQAIDSAMSAPGAKP